MMQRQRIALRGPVDSPVRYDDGLLRGWCRENLLSYWADWVRSARSRPSLWWFSLMRGGCEWSVLGVLRLLVTIRTGETVSKSAAGQYGLQNLSARWSPVIQEALAIRLGRRTRTCRRPFARCRDALNLRNHVIAQGTVENSDRRPSETEGQEAYEETDS